MVRREGAIIRARSSGAHGESRPVRTCVGCRTRASASELLRVVAEGGRADRVAVPDPQSRQPGRGAWLHRDPACLRLAERRRAFPRALRVSGPVDLSAVRDHLGGNSGWDHPGGSRGHRRGNLPRQAVEGKQVDPS